MHSAIFDAKFEADGRASNPARIAHYQSLLHSVLREMQQTERSALLHCGKEATRLGGHGPVAPLRAIVAHATEFEPQLAALFIEQCVPWPRVGDMVGRAMSFVRSAAFDKLARHERSYRATLLGVRHGMDVARMLRQVAINAANLPVAAFASQWLAGREPLIAPLADGTRWFAGHPGVARATVWARHAFAEISRAPTSYLINAPSLAIGRATTCGAKASPANHPRHHPLGFCDWPGKNLSSRACRQRYLCKYSKKSA